VIKRFRRKPKDSRVFCMSCGVETPTLTADDRCRCCVADEDPFHRVLGADTLASGDLMPPAPEWPKGNDNVPRLETVFSFNRGGPVWVWWMPRGRSWVPQHPLEFPRNKLKDLTSNL
jgi:hypothetical protein